MTLGLQPDRPPGHPPSIPERWSRLRRRGARTAVTRWRALPGWGQALAVFATSRVLIAFVMVRSAVLAGVQPDGKRLDYLTLVQAWDGAWYRRIADAGYPGQLPTGPDGHVLPNPWAFYPGYPWVTSWVRSLTGLDWAVVAAGVSTGAAAVAIVLVHRLLTRRAGPRLALWSVALLSLFPASVVLQLAYSEALALALLAGALLALEQRRYRLTAVLVVLLGLTRPLGVPMFVLLTVHVVRVGRARGARSVDLLLVWAAGVVGAAEWPLLCWAGTGDLHAYQRTMAAWRGSGAISPVVPWWRFGEVSFGAVIGPVLVFAALAAFVVWLVRSRSVLGADLSTWCLAYLGYLVLVLDSFTSLPRYLLPMFPTAALLLAAGRHRSTWIAWVLGAAGMNLAWFEIVFRSPGTYAP